jgi:hypothetical protein
MVSKAAIIIEETKNERLYQFVVPMGVPFAEAEEMALLMVEAIRELAKNAAAQDEAAKAKAAEEAAPAEAIQAEIVS